MSRDAGAPAATPGDVARGRWWARALVGLATATVILGVTVALLLNPLYVNAGLRHAGSATILGITEAQAAAVSDRTLGELVFGPGDFAFSVEPGGPRFYNEDEASHLRDARLVLWIFIIAALVSAGALVVVARRARTAWPWHAIAAGAVSLAIAFAAIGAFFTLAFDAAFELFHRIFFPGGNYTFDVASERMVQLYPVPFWELTFTVAFVIAIALGVATWFFARRQARRLDSHGRLAP